MSFQIALKGLFEECVLARGEAFRYSSEVQDLRSELDDLQRQYDEVVHEAANHDEEVQIKFKLIFQKVQKFKMHF